MDLTGRAKKVWLDTIRVHLSAPETRLASSVSAVEIFVSLFYGGVLSFDSGEPLAEDRDRFDCKQRSWIHLYVSNFSRSGLFPAG